MSISGASGPTVVGDTSPLCPDNLAVLGAKRRDRRDTVGFLTANIHIGASRTLWRGVVDAAASHDANLICFPGGGLRVSEGFEAQRNVIYELIDAERLDGLLNWSSTIGGTRSLAELTDFHQRYHPLPLVSLTQLIAGAPAVSVDSYQGMRAAITHLVADHGYRRIAFIRGPEEHYHAQERFQAYLDALQDYGLPLVSALITPPLPWEAGEEAIRLLLDERGLRPRVDIEAVVAVSDLAALEALKALTARGIRAPTDLAIVGFNDSVEGRVAKPPLTSVAMPFYEQGSRGVDALLARLEGKDVPAQLMLESRLVVRQSCGCPSQPVMRAAVGPLEARSVDVGAVFAELHDSFLGETAQARVDAAATELVLARVLDAFQAELTGAAPGRFLVTLEQALEGAWAVTGNFAAWQDIVSALRCCVLPYVGHAAQQQVEDMIGQARVLIGEVSQRAQAYRQLQAKAQAARLHEIGQALITAFDIDALATVLAERLPQLGIRSCYLSLYENAAAPLEGSRLILAYTEAGRVPLETGGRPFASRALAPDDLLPHNRRYSMVVEPLFFRHDQIGFILLEIGPRDPEVYEVLRGYISSALKGALLVQEARRARALAEKADRIKTRLLANVSHELRMPLHIILGNTKAALDRSAKAATASSRALSNTIQHIQSSAEHQLRLINDLLDLSRAEIDELDLYPELLDPRPLMEDAFHSLADRATTPADVAWKLHLPDRLPWLYADGVRLRQILLNLLSNAEKFTRSGSITLGAEVAPPHVHIWVEDTGIGIPRDQQERIFEPFVTAEYDDGRPRGIGLGLSITRRLVALHHGTMTVDSSPGSGSTFHLYLPLPSLGDQTGAAPPQAEQALLVISTAEQLVDEIVAFSQRQCLTIHRLRTAEDLESVLARVQPAALAWDLVGATPGDWVTVRRLRAHPRWSQLPLILYGNGPEGACTTSIGLTSFIAKPASTQTLLDTISASCPAGSSGPILIVDDDPSVRALHHDVVAHALPGYPIHTAEDGAAALALMAEEIPSLVMLDLMMPGIEGMEVLERMRADQRLRQIPVVILSNKLLNLDDVKQIEQYAHVTLHSKGILTEEELGAALNRAVDDTDTLPLYTSALVKRAIAYLQQHYARSISRWELAQDVGVSEDYLSRVFNQELSLSPWEYLNRYRIYQAKELLHRSNDSIGSIAQQVGFQDQRYFSRVFRKLTGVGPKEYRERPER